MRQVSTMTVLVVAKAPVAGLAKTRLMSVLSAEQAAAVAAAALLDTLDAVATTPAARHVVALTGDLDAATRAVELRRSLSRFTVLPQRGHGLGERLVAAHHDAAALLGAAHYDAAHYDAAHYDATVVTGGPVLQLGMDTPQVTAKLLGTACVRLSEPGVDAVLGLAEDGGWWGLGVRSPELARSLADVPMSRADTGRLTLRALRGLGARVELLDQLRDVDTPQDMVEVAALVPGSRFADAVSAVGCDDTGLPGAALPEPADWGAAR